MTRDIRVLWFRPARWKNVSVRRERISEGLESRGVDIDLVGATPMNFVRYGLELARGRYDVVIGNVRLGLYGGYLVARLTGTPFIGDVSDPIDDIDHLPKPLFAALGRYELFVLRHADAAVFLPETYKEVEDKGIDGVTAGNAVHFDQFADPDPTMVERAGEILADEGVSVDEPIAIYLGSLPENKYFEEIFDAAAIAEDWQFVVVGEGPMAAAIEAETERLDNLFFPGAFEYDLMPGFLAHADAAFCMEPRERPLKISEYGAAGLPTIGAYGKLEEVFPHDEVFYVEPGGEEIAEALESICLNPEEAQAVADKLREHCKKFSWADVSDTYYEEIKSVI